MGSLEVLKKKRKKKNEVWQDEEEEDASLREGKWGRREAQSLFYMLYYNCIRSGSLKMNHSSVGGYEA